MKNITKYYYIIAFRKTNKGCTKLRNEIEAQRTKRNETKRNETKYYEMQRNVQNCETKRNETTFTIMRNEMK